MTIAPVSVHGVGNPVTVAVGDDPMSAAGPLTAPDAPHLTPAPASTPNRAAVPRNPEFVGGPPLTTTDAVPLTRPLVATTSVVKTPAIEPAVYSPVCVIDAPLPVEETDHTGVMVMALPAKSFPTAVNCCVPAAIINAGFGG